MRLDSDASRNIKQAFSVYPSEPQEIYGSDHGESGTGKEFVACAIHHQGLRKDKPFVPVNLSTLTESHIESRAGLGASLPGPILLRLAEVED